MGWRLLLGLSMLCWVHTAWGQSAQEGAQDLFEKVFGRKQNSGPQELSASLWLDQQEQGPIRLRLNNGQLDALDRALLPVIQDLLLDTARAELDQLATEQAWLPRSALDAIGIHSEYRANTLELHLQLESAIRKPIVLAISQRQNRLPASNVLSPARYSGYGNLSFSSLFSDTGNHQYGLAMAGALKVRSLVLEYQADALWRDQLDLFRGPLTLVYDRPQQQQRFRLGDQLSQGSPLLAGRQIAGFSWSREDALQPDQPPYPGLEQQIDITTPTQLETRVNGQFFGRRFLQPGRYDLRDFPLNFGTNEVELILQGLDGSQQQLNTSLVRTPELLGARRNRYRLSLGLERDFSAGPWAYARDRWVLAAAYQQGWGNGLSSRHSLDYRAAEKRTYLGHGLSYGLPFALAQIDGLFSHDPGHCCASAWSASLVSYPARSDGPPLEWALRAQYAGRHFGRQPPSPVARWQTAVELQWLLGPGLRLGANLSRSESGEREISRRANLSLNYQPDRRWLARLSLNHRQRSAQPGEWGLSVALRFQWGSAGLSVGAQHSGLDHRSELNLQYGRYHQRGGHSIDARYSREPGVSRYEAYASLDSTRASADLGLNYSHFDETQRKLTNVNLNARSAWVWADGHFGISRQVNDSFAIFVPPADIAESQVLVGAYDDDYLAASGWLGPAVSGNLRAYEQRGFALDLLDYPLNREPGELQPQLLPSYRSGVVVPVGGATVFIIRLQVEDSQGQALTLQALSLQDQTGAEVFHAFTNKHGLAVFAGVTEGRYVLQWKGQVIDELSVSPDRADENYLIQHGTVTVGGN